MRRFSDYGVQPARAITQAGTEQLGLYAMRATGGQVYMVQHNDMQVRARVWVRCLAVRCASLALLHMLPCRLR
jgi:hypothetical protein